MCEYKINRMMNMFFFLISITYIDDEFVLCLNFSNIISYWNEKTILRSILVMDFSDTIYGKTNLLLPFPKLFHPRPDSMIIAAFDMNDKNTHHH